MAINQIGIGRNLGPLGGVRTAGSGGSLAQPTQELESDEIFLKVTPSMLSATQFQQQLAEYARAGRNFNVELVPEGAFSLPTPPPPFNSYPKSDSPAVTTREISKKLVLASGVACAGVGLAICAGLGALGCCFAADVLVDKLGPASARLSQDGALSVLGGGFRNASLLTQICIVNSAALCGAGGAVLGQTLGKLIGTAIAEPASLGGKVRGGVSRLLKSRPSLSLLNPLLLSGQCGVLGGLVGGYIVGGCPGALAVGTAGAIGAFKAAKGLGKVCHALSNP